MSCMKRMNPGTLLFMVGLLPLAASQAQAQSPSAASLLGSTVIALPSDTIKTDPDSNNILLGDLNLGDADLLGTQDISTISHTGSGINTGWIIGGALGAAGIAGLASGGGNSSAASLLRTPSSPVGPTFATELGSASNVSGNVITVSNGGTTLTGGGISAGSSSGGSNAGAVGGTSSGNASPFVVPGGGGISSGGGISPLSVTPEPGSLALLGGMSLMLTAVKLRRRKH